MSQNHPTCSSCNSRADNVKHTRRHNLNLCDICRSWIRMSLRRTRNVPNWISPDPHMTPQGLADLREQFRESFQSHHNYARRHIEAIPHGFAMGFSYTGPLDDRGWGIALSILTASHPIEFSDISIPNIPHSVVDEELSR